MNPPRNSRHQARPTRWIPLLCLLGAASVLLSQTLQDAAALLWSLALLSFVAATVLAVKHADGSGGTDGSRT